MTVRRIVKSERQLLLEQMFLPRNPPTMTIEEGLREEMEQGGILPPQQRARHHQEEEEEAGEGSSSSEGEEDESEEALRERREWDRFKDENPKGWGNTLR